MKRVTIYLKALILFAIVIVFSGCKLTEKQIEYYKGLLCKDSTSILIKEVPVIKPVYYQDSSILILYGQCDSLGQIYWSNSEYYKGLYTDLKATKDKNKFTFTSKVTICDTIRITVNDTVKFKQAVKEVERNFTGKEATLMTLGKIFIWEHCILLLILILYFVIRYLKKRYDLKLLKK